MAKIRPLYELIVIIPSALALVKLLWAGKPHLFAFFTAISGLFLEFMQFFGASCTFREVGAAVDERFFP